MPPPSASEFPTAIRSIVRSVTAKMGGNKKVPEPAEVREELVPAAVAAANLPAGTVKAMQRGLQKLLKDVAANEPALLDQLFVDSGWVWVCDIGRGRETESEEKKALLSKLGFVRSARGHMMPDGKTVGTWGRPFDGPLLSTARRTPRAKGRGSAIEPARMPSEPAEVTVDDDADSIVSQEAQVQDIEFGGRVPRIAFEMSETFRRSGWSPDGIRAEMDKAVTQTPGLVPAALEDRFLTFAGEHAERVADALGMRRHLVYTDGRVRLCLLRETADREFPDLAQIGIFPVLVGSAQVLDQVVDRSQSARTALGEQPDEPDVRLPNSQAKENRSEGIDELDRLNGAERRPSASAAPDGSNLVPARRRAGIGGPSI